MDFEQLLEESIKESVKENGQDDQLSKLILLWFHEVASGKEGFDGDVSKRRAEKLYDVVR